MNKRLTDEIERKVNDIIVDKLGVDPDMVKPEAELVKDLNADSLDAVEIVMELEHEFHIIIPDAKVNLVTESTCIVQQIYNVVAELI
jgi:acyl carrier protein